MTQGDLFQSPITLLQAKQQLMIDVQKGCLCPCCGQVAKLYKRPLNAIHARFLVWLVTEFEQEQRWYEAKECRVMNGFAAGGDYSKIVYWGLARSNDDPNHDGPQRNNGPWTPTRKGMDFVHDRISVPSHVYLYNGEIAYDYGIDGFTTKHISIRQALGSKFDYEELIRGIS